MSDEPTGFKVTDKRRFTTEGDARPHEQEPSEEANAAARDEPASHEKRGGALPPIDFATFILSLASSAQVHLGLIPNPATGASEKHVELAKQTIDILGMLEEKTRGNLAREEQRLLEGILYDLRMKYVEINT